MVDEVIPEIVVTAPGPTDGRGPSPFGGIPSFGGQPGGSGDGDGGGSGLPIPLDKLLGLFGGLLGGGGDPNAQIRPAVPINLGGGGGGLFGGQNPLASFLPSPTDTIGSNITQVASKGAGEPRQFGDTTTDEPDAGNEPNKFSQFAGKFGDNLNRTLSSPTKTAGLGLLGDMDPRLVYAGLLAAGLFDKGPQSSQIGSSGGGFSGTGKSGFGGF